MEGKTFSQLPAPGRPGAGGGARPGRPAAPLEAGPKTVVDPALRQGSATVVPPWCDGEQLMSKSHRPVADGQRGLDKGDRGRWLRWLCSPLVLKAVIAVARLLYELLRLKH